MQNESLKRLGQYLRQLDHKAELDELQALLEGLTASRADFGAACAFNDEHYQRNTIAKTHWYELVLLCWKPGQATPIHDHKGSACAFRVIEGVATERRFDLEHGGVLTPAGESRMPSGHVCAAEDADIHLVINEGDVDLITLHIYSPSLDKYNVYDHEQVVGAVRMELFSVPLTVKAGDPALDWVI